MIQRTAHEQVLWNVEPIWKGGRVFILASGPSMTQSLADSLRGERVMVINSTYKLAPWADVWFFTDNNVFEENKQAVADFPGLVLTLSRQAKREMPDKVKRLRVQWDPHFMDGRDGYIRQGRSSGHTGLSATIALGPPREVILLGYDMRTVNGHEHHHDDYAGRPRDLGIYEREFIPGFKGWDADAKRVGVEVLNATPNSALKEFRQVALDEVFACAA